MKMNKKIIKCIKCSKPIPKGRIKALPGTKTCVDCSMVKAKKAIINNYGEGDHNYQETIIVDDETYQQIQKIENEYNRHKFNNKE